MTEAKQQRGRGEREVVGVAHEAVTVTLHLDDWEKLLEAAAAWGVEPTNGERSVVERVAEQLDAAGPPESFSLTGVDESKLADMAAEVGRSTAAVFRHRGWTWHGGIPDAPAITAMVLRQALDAADCGLGGYVSSGRFNTQFTEEDGYLWVSVALEVGTVYLREPDLNGEAATGASSPASEESA